jgi:AcrR family transcriptional regulator
MSTKSYHHGDLRQALLEAAEAELTETGLEGFSLRKVARRAGVSHAAPAHHFKDTAGLLTALCAVGYRRFVALQKQRQAVAPLDARSQQIAAGLGYIDFADENTALFRLMFGSRLPDFENADNAAAMSDAYLHLANGVGAIVEDNGPPDQQMMIDISATWAIAHGLADLLSSGRLHMVGSLTGPKRDEVLSGIIARCLPER